VTAENSAFTIAERLLLPALWLASPVCHLRRPSTGTSAAPTIVRPKIQVLHDVEQFIADLEKSVDAVCTRIGQNKVAIMNREARVVAARAQRAARSCHAP
jgi:hypothetical protein